MSKKVLKNKLLKSFAKDFKKHHLQKDRLIGKVNTKDLFTGLLRIYMDKKTQSFIVRSNEYFDNQKGIYIKCAQKESECKHKKIKKFFSMNCDDVIHKVPNAKEVEKELTDLLKYLELENKIEVKATYNETLYYSFRMTVVFLNKEQQKIKEKESKLLKNVVAF